MSEKPLPAEPQKPRCGLCVACLTVEMTKRLVFSELSRPLGGGGAGTDATVRMWNKVLKDNPCNGDPSTGDFIRANEARLREEKAAAWKREAARREIRGY